uniref:SJCHGC02809 protein n=1 Tax=Schistosoma japonicum TaxID=6182 RepID=Q5D943_SCHJA|nr:SJCHGC02809 protein [Schistosoma japonicum]
MFRNLCNTYSLLIISFNITTYTCSLPFISRNYVNSKHSYKDDNIKNDYTLNDLLVPVNLPLISTSTDASITSLSSIEPISSSILSNINDEETYGLQLALALQIDSELNKSMNLEVAASESIQQANLLHKAAEEAKYHAKIAKQLLNSMKSLQNTNDDYLNNDKDDTDVDDKDDDDNNNENDGYKQRAFVKVPKINHDYLLDKEVGNEIVNDENPDLILHEHHRRHHHHQQQQPKHHQYHNHNRQKRRKVLQVPHSQHEFHMKHSPDFINNEHNNHVDSHDDHDDDDDDDDDDNHQKVLNNSKKTNQKLNEIEQLTLEKLRLLMLRQLIKQEKLTKEEPYQDDIQHILDGNDKNQQFIKVVPRKFIDYSLNPNMI